MNTNNLNQQQPLFGEPQFVEGTAGKKQLVEEPQFVTGLEKHGEKLTPLYTEPLHGARNPFTGQEQLGGDWQKIPISSGKDQLYPGQENFLPGNERLTSGGSEQTGEHLSLSPDKQQHVHVPSTEHVHLNPSEHVHLTPDAEHVHIKAGTTPQAGVEQVIRIKPDGRVLVTAEKVGEHGTSEHLSTEHKKPLGTEHGHGTGHKKEEELKKEHSTEHKKVYDTTLTEDLNKPHTEHETEHLHTQESKKKRLSDKGKHKDKTTETQTIVKAQEHEPGTAGYTKEGKLGKGHDDTHHRDKHDDKLGKGHDTHHRDIDTHQHGTDTTKVKVDKAHGDAEHVKVTTGKGEHLHDTEHLTAGKTSSKKEKHASDKTKHRQGTDETKVIVDKDTHRHSDDTSDKTKHHRGTDETKVLKQKHASDTHRHSDDTSDKTKRHHGTDETEVIVDKDKHRHGDNVTAVKVKDHDHDLNKHHTDTTTHVKAGTLSKPHDIQQERIESQGLLQQLRTTLAESETPNMDVMGELLLRAEVLLSKSALQPNVDPEARKTLEDISTLLITAKQMERHKAIAERLQKISDECQKALTHVRTSDAPSSAARSASKEAVDFINIWRPVFQLLIRSRDFRQLFVDSLRIAKRILARHEGILEDISQKFIEGESTQGMKEIVQQHREQNVNVKMTDEEWEYLQEEILNVLAVLARNPSYHDAIDKLFTLLDMFSSKSKEALPSSSGDLETHARKAKMETEELVVTFTGRETLNQFKFTLRRLIQSINNDPELKRYTRDLKDFILKSKSEEEIRSEAFKRRTREFVDRGRDLMNKSKNRNELDQFLEAANELIENIKNDEYVKELRARAGIVRSDLTYVDSEGRTKIDVDMLVKLQTVLIPVLADTFQKIHIPRIENSDPKLDFWVDNIVLCGYDILPDNIKFHVERDTELSIREFDTRGSHTRLVIHLDKLRTEVKNIQFYFKRKTFPALSDSGLVTFRIPENGAHLGIYFTIEDRPGESHPRLTEGYADFTIRKMDIEFDKSTLKHDVLIPMATGLMKPIVKSKIERAVENNLTNALKQLGDRLTLALGELNRQTVFGTMRDTIKTSVPAQVFQQRREKLE